MRVLLLFLIIISIAACQQEQRIGKTENELVIPELLQRSAVIGPSEEMGQMNDWYEDIAAKIRQQPEAPEHWLELAELFMQEARISGEHGYYFPVALDLVERVLKTDPAPEYRYQALLDKSSVLMSLHQFAEAKAVAEEAIKLNPHDAGIYGILVDANVELGNYAKAVEMADQMLSIRPDIRSYSRASYLREIHGDIPGAIEAMQLAVSAGYPGMEQTEWARLTLGNLYENYGQPDSAAYQYAMALQMRPNYPFAVGALAALEARKGNTTEAERKFNEAAALIPEVGFYIELAKLYKERGDRPEKVAQMTKDILAMLADDEKAGHRMDLEYAEVYLELLDDPKQALEYAQKEYKKRPANIDVNKKLAAVYYVRNEFARSQEHLEKALATGSQDPELQCLNGLLLAWKGDKQAGAEEIKKAYTQNPMLDCSFCTDAKTLLTSL